MGKSFQSTKVTLKAEKENVENVEPVKVDEPVKEESEKKEENVENGENIAPEEKENQVNFRSSFSVVEKKPPLDQF